MKPYTLLCEHSESDDITYGLYERDGIKYYQVNTQPVSSSKEVNCEHELAFMMSRPFKPAKQPKFLVIGLGVGGYLNALAEALPQKKAIFEVLDLNSKSGSWFKEHLVEESSTIGRTEFITNKVVSYVKSKSDQYHGIFFDPELWRSFGNKEDLMSKPYLNYFVNALKMGGLLGMITERSDKIVLGLSLIHI